MKLKKTQLFDSVIKLMKPSCVVPGMNKRGYHTFFILRITLMSLRILGEPLSNKHNYRTFSESSPASLKVHCIENILSHSSGKFRDSLTVDDLSSMNGCSEFHFCTIFIH